MGMKDKKKKSKRGEKWYKLAKEQGYRSRAAFKLIQLNKKYDFLSSAKVLLDLCAAPGGWLQVASKYMPVSSMIIGVDLLPIKPIKNVTTLTEDITTQKCRSEIKKLIKDWKVDVVLHDGSPSMGASWLQDAYSQSELVLVALKLATEMLMPGGTFVTKVFRSVDYNSLLWVLNQLFRKVEATKPVASRLASAEIFVVCQGYINPDKIDPKMLDPRYIFKELDAPAKKQDIFNQKQVQKRHRQGYQDGDYILFKSTSVCDFIDAADPVSFLAEYHQLKFDEKAAGFAQHPDTTPEIKSCLDDLKVLGKGDFKSLLKWRMKMREVRKKDERKGSEEEEDEEDDDEEEEAEPTPEEQEALISAEIDGKLSSLSKKDKKQRKKKALLLAKNLQRIKMNMGTDESFEAPTESNLFSLDHVKESDAPSEVSASQVPVVEQDDEEEGAVNHVATETEPKDYDSLVENYLDEMYDQYLTTSKQKSKKVSIGKKEKANKFTDVGFPVREKVFVPDLDQNVEEDGDEEGEEGEEDGGGDEGGEGGEGEGGQDEENEDVGLTKRAAQWFSKSIFKDVDSDEENESEKQPAKSQVYNSDSEEEGEDEKVEAEIGFEDGAPAESEGFEVVPQEAIDSDEDSEDEVDIDADKQIEMLALGTMMLSKKRKRELIDDSYNRYAFNDDGLPQWFLDEEGRHNKPQLPLTKELNDKIRQRFVEINARPIKKIAEAKARKKMKAIKRLEKVSSQAKVISDSSDMSEKEKMKALEKLYKKGQAGPKRPGSVYVVAKKGKQAKGGRGIKVVDPRLKKDKRAEKKNAKKQKAFNIKGAKKSKGKGKGRK